MKAFTERQWVTAAVYLLAILMLVMGYTQPSLWAIELYKVLLQAVVISGFINMVLAFHFAANKSDEKRSENTGKAFDAITATANAGTPGTASQAANDAAGKVAGAAQDAADDIKGDA